MSEPPEQPAGGGPSSSRLARSSALMASGTLVSRVLGLLRTALLVGIIGVTLPADAWETANTLPNTIYILLAGGILNTVFVPQITRALAREDKGRDLTDRLITLTLVALFGTTVIVTAGAYLVTKLYALDWSGAQLGLAVAFAYLCLPQVFFYGTYALLGQILNAQEKFGWYMWAPVANNIVAITGLVVFTVRYPDVSILDPGQWTSGMILLLGGTATLGVSVQAAVLIPPVRASGFRYRPRWGFRGVGLGAASRMAQWTLAIIGMSQLGLLAATNLLNSVAVDNPGVPGKAAFTYAFLIFILPHSLVATSLLTAMFPALSRAAAADDRAALGEQYGHGLRLLCTAMVPITIGMLLLAPQLVGTILIFSGEEATESVAPVVRALLVGLIPYGIYLLSQRIFHAYQEGRPPFKLQLAITTVSLLAMGVALLLPPEVSAVTLALGQSSGQIVAAVIAVSWVRRRLGGAPLSGVRSTFGRVLAASLMAAVPLVGVILGAARLFDGKFAAVSVLVVGGVVFFSLYAVFALRLGVREVSDVLDPLLRRLRRRRGGAPPGGSGPTPSRGHGPVPPRSPAPASPDDRRARLVLGEIWTPPEEREESMVHGIDTGTVLGGRYALEELLARRDDALDYWSASDETLDRLVAVTVLPATGEYEEMAHAVLDGARRTAGVDDPRLVRVLDVGVEQGICWIVEEGLSEAESLASLVAEQPLPPEEARRVVGEAAAGLESARRRGLHHLYLNPHSVLRTSEGSIKVSGVGVAAAIEGAEDVSADEASLIDTTDLLSLLYTGLTGRWPGEQIEGLRPARRLADGTFPAPSEVVSGVPGDLDTLCRMTFGPQHDPDQGPRTPGELSHRLAPWSPEIVLGRGGTDRDAQASDTTERQAGADAALAGAAGAAAASSAVPGSGASGAGGDGIPGGRQDSADDADRTQTVDTAYYRTAAAGGDGGRGGGGNDDLLGRGEDDQRRPLEGAVASGPPQRRRSGVVLGLVAAILAVVVFLAYGAVQGLLPEDGQQGDPGGISANPPPAAVPEDGTEETEEAPPTDEEQETATPTEDPEPITLAGITSYDPEGDGDERNDIVDAAIDGDPDTAWNSHTYLADNWGNLKSGVGLAVDLGESQDVSEVTIDFPEGDYGVEVFVGDEANLEDTTSIGSAEDAEGETTFTAEEAVNGRYVVIWFDRAWDGPEGEIVYVSEISVE